MLTSQALKALDCAGEVRNKLESLKVVYDLFCRAYLDGSEESLVRAAQYYAHDIQFGADAILSLLLEALDRAKEAENAANKAHSMAVSQEATMEKNDILRTIHKTFSLEDKRQLGEELLQMTAS